MDKLTEGQLSARYNSLNSRWKGSNNIEILTALLSDASMQVKDAYQIQDVNERQKWLMKYREMTSNMTSRITELAAAKLKKDLPDGVEYKEDKDI